MFTSFVSALYRHGSLVRGGGATPGKTQFYRSCQLFIQQTLIRRANEKLSQYFSGEKFSNAETETVPANVRVSLSVASSFQGVEMSCTHIMRCQRLDCHLKQVKCKKWSINFNIEDTVKMGSFPCDPKEHLSRARKCPFLVMHELPSYNSDVSINLRTSVSLCFCVCKCVFPARPSWPSLSQCTECWLSSTRNLTRTLDVKAVCLLRFPTQTS